MKCILRYMARKFWSEHEFDTQIALFAILGLGVLGAVAWFGITYPEIRDAIGKVVLAFVAVFCFIGLGEAIRRAAVYLFYLFKEAIVFCKGE